MRQYPYVFLCAEARGLGSEGGVVTRIPLRILFRVLLLRLIMSAQADSEAGQVGDVPVQRVSLDCCLVGSAVALRFARLCHGFSLFFGLRNAGFLTSAQAAKYAKHGDHTRAHVDEPPMSPNKLRARARDLSFLCVSSFPFSSSLEQVLKAARA